MQDKDIFSLKIPKHVKQKLIKINYVHGSDFDGITAEKLCLGTSLSIEECENVLACIKAVPFSIPKSVADHFALETQATTVSTGSKLMNRLLGGGIQLGRITEFCGLPATGKTQICMQLSINCQLPSCYKKGERGEVIYFDTENSFTTERLCTMAKTCIELETKNEEEAKLALETTLEGFISRVHYFPCIDLNSLLNHINKLDDVLIKNQKIRLLIIDNIVNPFRLKFESNYLERNSVLQKIVLTLLKLANRYDFAVVITNQMTTKVIEEDEMYTIPALGSRWSHCVCNRILLENKNEKARWATLVKSSFNAVDKCIFDIRNSGICDVGISPFIS